ncbi:MAG TPA: ABC transporter permease [Terracidiphilus sp.]|nr:ABC transporter permease [Terracidiphilus sp.]
MRRLRALWMRLLRSRRSSDDFDAELESHIAMDTEDGMRKGVNPGEARRQALIRLGGAEQTRQAWRERQSLPWIESLFRDVRYALRGFRRNPAFTVTVILTLALGIGATTAVFSVVDRILFRALPYAHSDRIVSVGLVQSLERQEFTLGGFFYDWQRNQRPFMSMTFERGVSECNLTESKPVALRCARVAQNFLPTLGVSLALGRNFSPEEDQPHGPKAAIISDALWLSRFNRDPGVSGKFVSIDGHPVRIVGVLPKNFEMPRLQETDILVPAQTDIAAQHTVNSGIGYPMWAFARLKPGVSAPEAEAEMQPLYKQTQQWIPAEIRSDFHLKVRSIRDRQMHDAYAAAWVLLGAVLAVLMIACANVASLFSARGVARERELAVRSALGASRPRLIRQTMTEAVLLAVAGAAAGYMVAEGLLRVFIAIAPAGIPFMAEARLDLRMMMFTALVALISAALFGVVPALEKPKASVLVARATKSGAQARLRRVLVAGQIAITVILLFGASLLVKSFRNLETQSLGMQTRQVLTVRVSLDSERYSTGDTVMNFYLRAESALRHVPGVTAIGISDSLPPDANSWHNGFRYSELSVPGHPPTPAGTGGTVVARSVTPGYFRVLRIPLIEGRGFTEDERNTNDNSVILSKLLAARLFPGEDPVGQRLQRGTFNPYFSPNGPKATVVGVSGNVKNAGLTGDEEPELYTLRGNRPDAWNGHNIILLETSLPMANVAPWVRSQIAHIDPIAPVEIEPLTQTIDTLADRPRFETALLGFFALTGLVMAIIGLYGVVTFMALQRTQEIGVRMALGASRNDILRLVLREGLRLLAFGGAVGLTAALGLSQALKSLLFGVGPHDPASFVAVTTLLGLVALVAALIPARRAAAVDPMVALRAD